VIHFLVFPCPDVALTKFQSTVVYHCALCVQCYFYSGGCDIMHQVTHKHMKCACVCIENIFQNQFTKVLSVSLLETKCKCCMCTDHYCTCCNVWCPVRSPGICLRKTTRTWHRSGPPTTSQCLEKSRQNNFFLDITLCQLSATQNNCFKISFQIWIMSLTR
jgi:hypothetical protein